MQRGIEEGMFVSLPKSETEDFLVKDHIREKLQSSRADMNQTITDYAPHKINYAK